MINIGDTVEITADDSSGFPRGYIGKVTGIDPEPYMAYEIDNEYYYAADEINVIIEEPHFNMSDPIPSIPFTGITDNWEPLTQPKKIQVKLKPLTDTAVIPQYATVGSACFDLCADEDVIVEPGQTIAASTGLSFELPIGYQMKVLPRSGISLRTPLRVVIGTVDSDYRGEVKVILWNTAEHPGTDCGAAYRDISAKTIDGGRTHVDREVLRGSYKIRKGDRIAQAEVIPVTQVSFEIVEELNETVRGEKGFGSSGIL